jgi:methyl-accepting chemotaxis protein
MKISTRIGSGFSVICALTLLLGYISWNSIISISDQIKVSTLQTGPLVKESNVLSRQLIEIRGLVQRYLLSQDDSIRKSLKQEFVEESDLFSSHWERVQSLFGNFKLIQELSTPLNSDSKAFFDISISILQSNHRYRERLNKVRNQTVDFSYLRVELDSELQNILSNATDLNAVYIAKQFISEANFTMALLASLPNLVKQKEIERALKDIDNQYKNHLGQQKLLQSSKDEVVQGVLSIIQDFMDLMSLDTELVGQFRQMLQTQDRIKQQMQHLDNLGQKTQNHLTTLSAFAEELAINANKSSEQILRKSTLLIIIMLVLVLIISIIVTIGVIRSVSKPLQQISKTLSSVTAGQLTQRAQATGVKEFDSLAIDINKLVSQLSELMREIKFGANELADSAEKTLRISSISSLKVDKQQNLISQTAVALNQMSASAIEVANNAQQTLNATHSIDASTQEGEVLMQASIQSVQKLSSSINLSSQVVTDVQQKTKNIDSVLQVIKEISEQTNLLALNAAIEAARAGEMGRGFAVVADEVRSLASRTQGSTEEIQKIIEALQQQSSLAVDQLLDSNKQAHVCESNTTQLQLSLQNISQDASHMREMNVVIASAVDEQKLAVHEVTAMTENMQNLSFQSQQDADQTKIFSEELKQISSKQIKLISWFKL